MPEKSILDARLEAIDRRLRTIQSGLAPATQANLEPPDPEPVVPPEAAPAPKRLSDAPAASEAADLVAQLRALVEAHERLLARTAPAPEQTVGVSVGPFGSTDELRRFEHSLRALPDVRDVAVREYAGSDRVVIDVQLAPPNP